MFEEQIREQDMKNLGINKLCAWCASVEKNIYIRGETQNPIYKCIEPDK